MLIPFAQPNFTAPPNPPPKKAVEAECGRWAEKLAQFEHPKIQAVRLAADPNTPLLPENMTLDQLRDSIIVDLERLREAGVLDFPRLPQGDVDKS